MLATRNAAQVQKTVAALTTHSRMLAIDVVNGLRYAIACSVQRGNALIAVAGYANALRVYRDGA